MPKQKISLHAASALDGDCSKLGPSLYVLLKAGPQGHIEQPPHGGFQAPLAFACGLRAAGLVYLKAVREWKRSNQVANPG